MTVARRLAVVAAHGKHGPVTDRKRPIDQAIELTVYAPLGFVLEARRLLPTFVDRGKAQVQMTKMIGRFAVQQGQTEAEKRLAKAKVQADAVLGELGLRTDDAPASTPPSAATKAPAAATTSAAPARPAAQSGAGADDLAITDYDSLAASQVIPRLDALSDDELAAVARYESSHRARKTILGKINKLQGA